MKGCHVNDGVNRIQKQVPSNIALIPSIVENSRKNYICETMHQVKMEILENNLSNMKSWLSKDSVVELPAIQRGFVWKPSQIENLWDSVFREFPMGSFLLTKTGKNLMLIDGQQRATSLALGYYNPWEADVNRLGNVKNLPVIWLDVSSMSITENREYAFRVVTRSHPWGYQLINNNKVLSIPDRRASASQIKEIYGEIMYTKLNPSQRLPYDAYLPIPLCFLLSALESNPDSYINWKEDVALKCKAIPQNYHPKRLPKEKSYHSEIESCDLSLLYSTLVHLNNNYIIPALVIDNRLILKNDGSDGVNPTLFVRLNSGGTQLEGDELIYSIYKAVCPSTKELVESIGSNIIPPSKIISLASRLVLSNLNNKFYSSITITLFQREILNEKFKKALESLIGEEEDSSLRTLIEKAITILKYDGTIPDTIVKKFVKDAPDGFLLLIKWLYRHLGKDLTPELKAQICSKLHTNYWFGDLTYIVQRLWNKSEQEDFWSISYHNDNYLAQKHLVNPNSLEVFLLNKAEMGIDLSISPNDPIWQEWISDDPRPESLSEEEYIVRMQDGWNNFLWRLLNNRHLVLLAQREYINRCFPDYNQIDDLQDTERPWDWDHIYPESWVYYQRNIDDRTRYWEWRIGNFRAMSLTDNRSENNKLSPAERFATTDKDYFINDNDLKFWKQLTSDKGIKKSEHEFVMIHAKAIIIRSVNIYRNLYAMFAPHL